jgi:hypothetical protein
MDGGHVRTGDELQLLRLAALESPVMARTRLIEVRTTVNLVGARAGSIVRVNPEEPEIAKLLDRDQPYLVPLRAKDYQRPSAVAESAQDEQPESDATDEQDNQPDPVETLPASPIPSDDASADTSGP